MVGRASTRFEYRGSNTQNKNKNTKINGFDGKGIKESLRESASTPKIKIKTQKKRS